VAPGKARHSALRHLVFTFFEGSTLAAAAALLEMSESRLTPEEKEQFAKLIVTTREGGSALPLLVGVFRKSGAAGRGFVRGRISAEEIGGCAALSTAIVALFVAAVASRALPRWTAVTPTWQ
jgi:hypothetical protein